MDKSLKKLSRAELLEILVKLSEENEALASENLQLQHALAQKPQLSSSAKVGSIAEAALQANGYFEAAQRSADEYLREIKRMRDRLATRSGAAGALVQSVPDPTPAAVQDAKARAQAIIRRANSQAEAIVADARKRSDDAVADANRRAHAVISNANRQADAILTAARNSAAPRASHVSSPSATGRIMRARHVRMSGEGA